MFNPQNPIGPGSGNRVGTRWRGKLPVPPGAHPLVRRFVEELNAQDTTITEVADRSGVDRHTISGWRYSACPTIDLLNAALNVLDLELVIQPRHPALSKAEKTAELRRLWDAGKSFSEIAAELCMSRGAVAGKCARLGLKRKARS